MTVPGAHSSQPACGCTAASPSELSQAGAPVLDLFADPIDLTAALVDIESVSRNETAIADAVEDALARLVADFAPGGEVTVERWGNTIAARTHCGFNERVILAGHLDTVPTADNVPSRREVTPEGEDLLWGCGTVDMKSGDAVFLAAFARLVAGHLQGNAGHPGGTVDSNTGNPTRGLTRDITLIMYECEEVAAAENGLFKLANTNPEVLAGDVAILGEPTGTLIEGGCQGSIRVRVTAHGHRAHSARSWLGENAMHRLSPVIARVANHNGDLIVPIDGLEYREGFNIVMCESGVATNTIPDEAWMFVNYRYAPYRSVDEALAVVWDVLGVGTPDAPAEGFTLDIDDISPGALPGLQHPAAAALIEVMCSDEPPRAKYGWTDVARFAQLGIPAVNCGPGDPAYCHRKDEHLPTWMITTVFERVMAYLTHRVSR